MIAMRHSGQFICGMGLFVGLLAMMLPGGHTAPTAACWAIALFIGLPLWVVGVTVDKLARRREKRQGYPKVHPG